jgi:hypothetical protein
MTGLLSLRLRISCSSFDGLNERVRLHDGLNERARLQVANQLKAPNPHLSDSGLFVAITFNSVKTGLSHHHGRNDDD